MTNDSLNRFIFENAPVRGEFIHLKESFQSIVNQHNYPEPIRRLLGEALCVAGLLSAIIKFDGRLTVQFRGKGKLKLLLAQCTNDFQLRGLVKWDGELSYDDLMEALKDGVLAIMLDAGLKNRYQGIVAWQGSSLAESIEGYFRVSEQLATKIWLTVTETEAAGFLLQIVPNAGKDSTSLEEAIHNPQWSLITQKATELNPNDLLKMDYQDLLIKLYPQDDIRVFEPVPVIFQCTCSRKRGEDAILILGEDEAKEELKNNHSIVVTCDFCNKEYIFDDVDVAKIFADKSNLPPDSKLH